MKERILHLSHQEYSELLEQRCLLAYLRFDGEYDYGAFTAWAIRRFALDPYTAYRIKVEA